MFEISGSATTDIYVEGLTMSDAADVTLSYGDNIHITNSEFGGIVGQDGPTNVNITNSNLTSTSTMVYSGWMGGENVLLENITASSSANPLNVNSVYQHQG